MGYEFELKFRATPDILKAIRRNFPEDECICMQTTYYDTPEGRLSAQKITLRRRLENGRSVCTLKTPAGALGRGEFEVDCDNIREAFPMLCKLSGLSLFGDTLVPVCGARFTRLAKALTLPECVAELALDEGVLLGGDKELPLFEVEIELKSGSRQAVCDFAQTLASAYGLIPEEKSKFRRALDMAKGAEYGRV